MINEAEPVSVRRQCGLLDIWRSGFYYETRNASEDTDLANEIHDIWQRTAVRGLRIGPKAAAP